MKLLYRFNLMGLDSLRYYNPNLEVRLYPAGSSVTPIVATPNVDLPGEYTVVIDPTEVGFDSSFICPRYDVKLYDSETLTETMLYSNKNLGGWRWVIRNVAVLTEPEDSIVFADLTDTMGDALPANIPNALVLVLAHHTDRAMYAKDITSTGFTLGIAVAGSSDPGECDIAIEVTD
jgi:hypothetical protein